MTKKNIGLIGFGVIGSGLYSLINKNKNIIKKRTGIDFSIKIICDLEVSRLKKEVKNIEITNKWQTVIENDEIDIIVELIGGLEPAGTIIKEALKKGKSVVTANKKLLAENGSEIFSLIQSTSNQLGFEAAIGGGIPCVLSLCTGLVGNNIQSIIGILNGTTNYILTKMETHSLTFDQALKDAQKKGYAEADPTFDIEGKDAGHKIALIAMLAYNKKIDFNTLQMEGITKINEIDISYAKEMGYKIKLLGIARKVKKKIDIRVHPTMIPEDHPLSAVNNEFNAIHISGDMTDEITLSGKGAGSLPTASAVLSDIVQIAMSEKVLPLSIDCSENATLLTSKERESKYYLRIQAQDKHGILAKIASALDKENISISKVIQKDNKKIKSNYVQLIIMTHKCCESGIIKAAKEINKFDFIDGDLIFLRVEDLTSK